MWLNIIQFLRYIDVFNFSLTCERFCLVLLSYKAYRKRLSLSRAVFGSDPNTCHYFVNNCLDELSENICVGFSTLFKSRKYLKSILDIELKKISYKLLPFKIHEHLLFCQRGIRSANRCNFCTRFFLKYTADMVLVKNAIHLFSYQFSHGGE